MNRTTLAALVLLASIAPAMAADQTILGKQLSLKNPGGANKAKALCAGKEADSPNTVVGNPAATGAILELIASGNTPSQQSFALPQGTDSKGKPLWVATATGYVYKDPKGINGAVQKVKIQRKNNGTFLLSAKVSGSTGTLNVLPPNPGTEGCLALSINGGDRYSVAFAPDATISANSRSRFKLVNPTAQSVCATVPTTTTVTTSTTTSTTLAGSCASSNFLDVSGAAGPGGSYTALVPSVTVSCSATTVTVQSNGIPTYQYTALTPNGLQAKSYTFTFPRSPTVAASTTNVPLLGNLGVAVNGIPIYGVNEGPQPATDAYGDPIAAGIMDQCGSHSAPQGTFHNHKLVMKCLLQSAVSSSQPWNNADPSPTQPSPIAGYAFDGFPIYGPYECTDLTCTSVQLMRSSWDNTGYQAGTVGCASSAVCSSGYCAAVMIGGTQTTACVPKTCTWSNNAYSAKAGTDYLDQCNGHVGPGGDYHYHATATFPYTLGCYRGTPTTNGGSGTPPGGTCP